MGSKIEYVDPSQIYATKYVRNSKAISVLWAIFTICYAIIAAVALMTPEWIGNTANLINYNKQVNNLDKTIEEPIDYPLGKFGLFSQCDLFQITNDNLNNIGQTNDNLNSQDSGDFCSTHFDLFFKNDGNLFFGLAAIFVALAVVFGVLAILGMMLFCFCAATRVFFVCGWIQLLSGICLIIGCTIYPAGFDNPEIRKICSETADKYNLGNCTIRWAYLLAAIGCLDAVILATLAFILATRHVKLQAEPHYAPASLFKGEMNSGFMGDSASVAGSRKSLNLHPVLVMHPGQDDTYSQFSQRTVPRSSHHLHQNHNFQL